VIVGDVYRGVPLLKIQLHIPRLSIQGDLMCLIDTGADTTLIQPEDAQDLGSPSRDISPTSQPSEAVAPQAEAFSSLNGAMSSFETMMADWIASSCQFASPAHEAPTSIYHL